MDTSEALGIITPDFIIGVWKRVAGQSGTRLLTGIPEKDIRVATLAKIQQYLDGSSRDMAPWFFGGMLLHHLVTWRPFVEGNHQTAWIVCRTYMDLFGYKPIVSQDEVIRFLNTLQDVKKDGEVRAQNWVQQAFQA